MTCFAVCAAMRPKSIGGSGSVMKSPISASALSRWPSASGIWVASFSTASTTSRKRSRRISPLRAVDLGADVVFLAVFRAAGLLDRLLHRLQHLVAVDALVARDGVGDLQQFGAGVGDGAFHRRSRSRLMRWASVRLAGLLRARRSDRRSERAWRW